MVGRRSQRWSAEDPDAPGVPGPPDPVCPLCERPIPRRARSSLHHLTPKLKGGTHRGTVRLHQICHSAIHARYSEAEIAKRLADVEALRAERAKEHRSYDGIGSDASLSAALSAAAQAELQQVPPKQLSTPAAGAFEGGGPTHRRSASTGGGRDA